jgi:MFS family permease
VRIFRGWIVVAATHACLFVIFGVAYSFAAFFEALEREFAASRGDVSLVFAICGFLYFMVGAFAGQLADRFGPRRVVLAGIVFLALGLAAASRANSLAALYVTYSIGIGLGVGCVYVPSVGAVQPWFIARRGLASGLAVAGIGVGNFVVPLVSAQLVEAFGWRRSFEILAAGAFVLGGLAALLIENRPQQRGLYPDGARAGAGVAPPAQVAAGIALREAMRTRAFWLQWGAIFACSIGLFIPFVHLVPYARDAGHRETTAVLLVSLIGVGSMIGRFALGGLADRIERRALHAVLYGAFYGAFVALQPPLAMDLFGGRNVAGVIGVLYTAAGVGNLLGPWLAGVAYDLTRSYAAPIVASIVMMLAAVALALALRRAAVT